MWKAIGAGVLVAIATGLTLGLSLGNIGLQRSVAIGPGTLLERPLALVLTLAVGLGVAGLAVWGLSRGRARLSVVVASVIVCDLLASVILAPLAVGELDVDDWPAVFLVISLFGSQPAVAGLGAAIAARWPSI